MLLAVLLPLVEFQTALDEDGGPFAKILSQDFGSPPPKGNVHESDFFNPFTGCVFAFVIDGNADIADLGAIWDGPKLGISA